MSRSLALALLLLATSTFAWTTHGPTGSSVIASAAAPSDSRVLYVTTYGGVLRSDDAGASWRDITNGLIGAGYLAVDPADANRVYVTTTTGVARSSDGGASWTVATIASSGFPTTGLEVDRLDSNVLYTGGHCDAELFPSAGSGFFRSADRGATWSFVPVPGAGCITELALDPLSSAVYADENDGPSLRLPHGGTTFEKLSTPLPTRAIVVDPRNSSVRYGISSCCFSLIVSTDGGATWGLVGSKVEGTFNTLAVDPATGRLFLGTSSGLFRSGNGGQSWALVGTLPKGGVTAIMIGSDSITVGADSGVFRTTDAMVTWTRIDTGDAATTITQVVVDPADPSSVYAGSGSIFHTSDFGNSWTYLGEMPGAHLVVDAGGQLYAVLERDLYRRDGDGWDHILQLPDRISAFVPDAHVPGTLWLRSEYQIRVTHDRGQSFEDLPIFGQSDYAVVADSRRSNILYALYAGLYRSADGGLTWTELETSGVGANFVAPPPSDPSFVYAWDTFALFRVPTDGGAATKIADFPDHPDALVVDPNNAKTLYLATPGHGILRSTDGGVTWSKFGDFVARSLAVDNSALFLHAGTFASGVQEQRLVVRPRAVRGR
jgi:photosystem II stability/assembly factor-like uncharacterized protein